MDIHGKVKLLAETMTGYSVIVDTENGANVEISKTPMPCILIFIQESGEFDTKNSHYRDSIDIRIAFLNLMPKGFKESDVETTRYALKQDMILLYHKLKYDFQFKINTEFVKYEIVYDEYDDNLVGVVFSDNIKERVGKNLACYDVDSIGNVPSEIDFCERVSECGTIISIQQLIDELQDQFETLQSDLQSHISNVSNPHNVTPLQLGLENVDNTSDENKPVSIAQAAAIQVVQDDLDNHKINVSNPHETTLEQVRSENNVINGNIDANGNQIDNLLNPVSNQQASTKNYTDTAEANAKAYADTVVQSNIKIIGDWNAASGAYPKNDESNTTPFISQWGNVIKQGWAFRVGYGQNGTVHTFEYENGDVVYALIDNPTDNPTDWGDLDHNLQQANESLRGTAKVITAAIASDENTLDDERFLTGKKLWLNFLTRVLAIAHTFAAKITFSTAPRFSSVTGSQVLTVDSNKDLTSESKGTAFNKNFGTTSGTVTEGGTSLLIANNLSDITSPMTAKNNLKIWSIYLSSGDQLTTLNTPINITELVSNTLTANKRYKIHGIIHFGCNNTGGVKFACVIPSGATMWINQIGKAGSSFATLSNPFEISGTLQTTAIGTSNNENGFSYIYGEVSIGSTAGTIQFQFASGTNGQTSTIFQLGTHLILEQIN